MEANDAREKWKLLYAALDGLCISTHARNAYVLDSVGGLYCVAGEGATEDDMPEPSLAATLVQSIVQTLNPPLRRGGKIDCFAPGPQDVAYLRSFAGLYILMLCFSAPV